MATLDSKRNKVIKDLSITVVRNTAKVDMLQSKVTDLFITIDELQNIKGFKRFFFVYLLPSAISKYWILYNYNMKLVDEYMKQYQSFMRRNDKYITWVNKLLEDTKNV